MTRCSPLTAFLAGLLAAIASAQNAPTMATVVKQNYYQLKDLLTRAADAMPEDGYRFQPTAPERNFGGWVAHVADSQMAVCSALTGERKNLNGGTKTAKADLVAALKESFAACDVAFDGLTDANAADPVPGFRGAQPRLTTLFSMLSHDNECYGSMAVYLRLKGIVPPSSDGGGMPRSRKKQ